MAHRHSHTNTSPGSDDPSPFGGGGTMGKLIRQYDWGTHPLGEPDAWSASLTTSVRNMLHSGFPMFIWWSDEFYLFHNDRYLPALGNKHPAALGSRASEVWSDIWPTFGPIAQGILDGDESYYAEEQPVVLNRHGFAEETYWTFTYSPIYNDSGAVGGILGVCQEVTRRILSERRLTLLKELADQTVLLPTVPEVGKRVADVLQHSPDDVPFALVYLLEADGQLARCVGQTDSVPAEQAPATIDLAAPAAAWPLAQVRDHHQPVVMDEPQTSEAAASAAPPLAVVLPILQPDQQQLRGFFVAGISPRLKYTAAYENFFRLLAGQIATAMAQVEAREKAYRMNALLDNGSDFIGLATPEGEVMYMNPAAKALVGLPPSQDLSKLRIMDFFCEEDRSFVQETILPAIHEHGRWVGEYRFRHFRTGQAIPVHYNLFAVRDPTTDEWLGIATISTDITERKQREQKLQQYREELAAANEELTVTNEELLASNEELAETNRRLTTVNNDLDNFVYAASHDLKGPISNIQGLLQVLELSMSSHDRAAPRTQKVLSMMDKSVARFMRTLADLSEITRLQKQSNLPVELVNLSEVIEEVRMDIASAIEQSNARIVVEVAKCGPVRFAPKNLRSVVYNLLSNAVKYRDAQRTPEIFVRCEIIEGYQVLTVTDNGLGMDLNENSRLFTMFRRLHDHVEGTGVGLYIVKKIVENAGGKIEVESKLGQGTTFRVFFKR